jgi:hypothetical protein
VKELYQEHQEAEPIVLTGLSVLDFVGISGFVGSISEEVPMMTIICLRDFVVPKHKWAVHGKANCYRQTHCLAWNREEGGERDLAIIQSDDRHRREKRKMKKGCIDKRERRKLSSSV